VNIVPIPSNVFKTKQEGLYYTLICPGLALSNFAFRRKRYVRNAYCWLHRHHIPMLSSSSQNVVSRRTVVKVSSIGQCPHINFDILVFCSKFIEHICTMHLLKREYVGSSSPTSFTAGSNLIPTILPSRP
jgi:hypothetical protein